VWNIDYVANQNKIVSLDKKKEHASIDYGDGTKRKANVSLVDVKIGDYVLVHAGFAIQCFSSCWFCNSNIR